MYPLEKLYILVLSRVERTSLDVFPKDMQHYKNKNGGKDVPPLVFISSRFV